MRAGRLAVGPAGALACAGALLLAACGGGGGGGGGVTLRGTAATGTAMGGATITAVGADGQAATDTAAADGTFSVTGGLKFPAMLRAQGGGVTQFSWAHKAGRANITPLSTLALMVQPAVPNDLPGVFANWSATAPEVTEAGMAAAQAVVNKNLQAQMTTNGLAFASYDFRSANFAADGTGLDALLDALDFGFDFAAGTFGLTAVGTGTPVPFDPNIDTSDVTLGGLPSVGAFGTFAATLTGVTLGSEAVDTATFRPGQPAVAKVPGNAAASTYTFAGEPIGFVTPGGQALAQTFTATVNTADGSTLRRLDYTVGLASDPSAAIHLGVDCAAAGANCGALVITPATGGTGGKHSLLTTSSILPEIGAAGTPASVTLIGVLHTAAPPAGGGGGGGGGGGSAPFGTLAVGNSPPALADEFSPDSSFTLVGAHWTEVRDGVEMAGFDGIAMLFLHVYFDDANPAVLTNTLQYSVGYVPTVSGTAPATSFYQVNCLPSCAAADLGVTVNTGARTVTFSDTHLPEVAGLGSLTDHVVLNGTLSY